VISGKGNEIEAEGNFPEERLLLPSEYVASTKLDFS